MSIRVLLADDHPLFLDGLDQLLRLAGDFDVVERASDGEAALLSIQSLKPDVAVLDIRMPGLNGIAVLREIRRRNLPTKVVLLTASLAESDLLEAVRLGVDGVVLKEMAPRLLLQCLHKVHMGGRWVENRAVHDALEAALRREVGLRDVSAELTSREIEMVRMVAEGLRNKEIGRRLDITEGTVKTHLRNIYRKLGLDSRVAVRRYAEGKGLV
jgi:DNA-binding NarL/FixJ family response regulator